MIDRRRAKQNATMCPKCGANMRAATAPPPEKEGNSHVWRCIRCGGETPRLARRVSDQARARA